MLFPTLHGVAFSALKLSISKDFRLLGWRQEGSRMDEMRRRAAVGELRRLKHLYYSKCVSKEAGIPADLILIVILIFCK